DGIRDRNVTGVQTCALPIWNCPGCRTTLAGTHADVRRVVPEGLTIQVKEMRELVHTANRRPSTGRWLVVIIEDADRLTEGAANRSEERRVGKERRARGGRRE